MKYCVQSLPLMNRYPGSEEDSLRQSSQRDQRAARRYIASNVTTAEASLLDDSSASANFEDCEDDETPILSVDGQDDAMTDAAARKAAEMAKPFDIRDLPDDSEAWKKTPSHRFDKHDVEFWVNNFEAELTNFGINSQWSKRNSLLAKDILPAEVVEEMKPLFRLTKVEAGDTPYKDIKNEILSIYGKKDEDACEKAASRRLTSRPSALGKLLIHDLCPGAKPFRNCHCARVVWWFFIKQMPQVIRTALAEKRFNADSYNDIFKLADDVFNANKMGTSSDSPAVVAAVTQASLDETQPAIPYPVEAASFRGNGRGRGRGRGGRGGGRGAQSSSSSSTTATKANDSDPANLCSIHKKWKKEAFHCRDPFVCPWAKHVKPKNKD